MTAMIDGPTPEQIRDARGTLSMAAAAALVFASTKTWLQWERPAGHAAHRKMPAAAWWLFRLRTGQAKLSDLPQPPI